MITSSPTAKLRRTILLDGVVSGATGLLLVAGAGMTAAWRGIPPAVLRLTGIVLLAFACGVLYLATREDLPRPAVLAVILLNALWVAGSLLLVAAGWLSLTTVGMVFVILQALVVAAFAEMQYVGLRRSPAVTTHG